MKPIRSQFLLIASALFVVALMLAACGRQAQPTPSPEPTQPAPTETEIPASPTKTPTPPPVDPSISAPEMRILYVAPALADCKGAISQKCLLIKDAPDGNYQLFYEQIEGFAYEEGYEYEILVEITQEETPAAGQPTRHYALIEVISKTSTAETTGAATERQETPLEGTNWRLIDYVNTSGELVPAAAESTALFENGLMTGQAGCTPYSAAYEVTGPNKMAVSPNPMIMKACEDDILNKQQAAFLAALPQVAIYSITDGELELGDAEGKVLLRFEAKASAPLLRAMWRVVAYNDGENAMISPLEGTELTAIFGKDGMLAGSAGCNRYAAAYEINGEAIKISAVATTRKFCPEPEGVMDQEMMYLSSLQHVATYRIQGEQLELRDKEGTLMTTLALTSPEDVEFEYETLANLTYKSAHTASGEAPLRDGEYSEPAAPGSAAKTRVSLTDHVAVGRLNGQPAAAVVLVTTPGGSGAFYDLAIVTIEDGVPSNVATVLLGERVQIKEIAIEDDSIVVNMVTHGPEDPRCCPTQETLRTYELRDGQLNLISEENSGLEVRSATLEDLIAHPWKWMQTTFADGGLMALKYPERYQVAFAEDGTLQIRSDCNAGEGVYRLDEDKLTIDADLNARKSCPRGSKTQEFITQLNQADIAMMIGDNLLIRLQTDAGNMLFEPVSSPE
ncbi:MAG: META domain-containing protein [Chloroflexi bacterium]|nr:META domain-containing protein [Chloroflexota bacterium]